MSDNILDIFKGLKPEQVRELRKRIIPALLDLRSEVVAIEENETFDYAAEADPAKIREAVKEGKPPKGSQRFVQSESEDLVRAVVETLRKDVESNSE